MLYTKFQTIVEYLELDSTKSFFEGLVESLSEMSPNIHNEIEQWLIGKNSKQIQEIILENDIKDQYDLYQLIRLSINKIDKDTNYISPEKSLLKMNKIPKTIEIDEVLSFCNTLQMEIETLLLHGGGIINLVGEKNTGKTYITEYLTNLNEKYSRDITDITKTKIKNYNAIFYDNFDILNIQEFIKEKSYCSMINILNDKQKIVFIVNTTKPIGAYSELINKVITIPKFTTKTYYKILSNIKFKNLSLEESTCKTIVNIIEMNESTNILNDSIELSKRILYNVIVKKNTNKCNKKQKLSFDRSTIGSIYRKMINSKELSTTYIKRFLNNKIIGQNEIVDYLSNHISDISNNLVDPTRPAGVFLFYGNTGCGKTEMAKTISDLLFNGIYHKEDMSTYKESHSVSRMIGSPPGYANSNTKTGLTSFFTKYDRGIVILDEIEKAHPNLFDLLMETFDTGIFVDAMGISYNVKRFLFIMTSNIKTNYKKEANTNIGFCSDDIKDTIISPTKEIINANVFKKEFIGRIQKICKFKPIDKTYLKNISILHLTKMLNRLNKYGYNLSYMESDIDEAIASYDENQGVRSIISYMEDKIKYNIIQRSKSLNGDIHEHD